MKRRFGGTVIAMVLCFILTVVSVYADDGKGQNPDYVTDYYMIVQSTQGGVDIYDEADTQSVKLNDSKIPNGTAIHVLGEKNGADNKKWASTQYHCYYCSSKPSLHNLFPSFLIFFLQQMNFYICCMYFHMAL